MNINLANIDFSPAQGGGGEAVIRTLNVTENGTYRAPSGVDGYNPVNVSVSGGGGSVTPEEQAALDTLVNSSEGALYTNTYKRYNQVEINWPTSNNIYGDAVSSVNWDDLYVIDGNSLYKLNRESYQFDMIKSVNGIWAGPSFFGDKSGRFYWNGYEVDLENGTIGQVQINMPDVYKENALQNFLYGEYGVWILGNNAYKFNESTQEFVQMSLNSTFAYSDPSIYTNMFKYDGHILGVYNGSTFEVTEYEDHIDVADVTDVYFNMHSFGDQNSYKSTKDGDLYYILAYDVYIYDTSLGDWVSIDDRSISMPIYGYAALVSDNIIVSFYNGSVYYMNLGPEFNQTSWTKTSNFAVDLTSNQKIKGEKRFEDLVTFVNGVQARSIYSQNNMIINAQTNSIKNMGSNIIFVNNQGNETIVKNGSKHIATVDQTFVNGTFIPYGSEGDNLGYISGDSSIYYNFNTYTNRMFKKVGNDWYEFDGTSTLIPVSFGFNFNGDWVSNSPAMTIIIAFVNDFFNTYMWNDANTRWDLICTSNDVTENGSIWFDGDNFRSGNEYKLVETGGVWSWVSDPLVNTIYDYYLKFVYKSGEVYAYNDNDWHLYKYDKVNCTLDNIGFVNAGRICGYFDELFMTTNSNETYIIDLSRVDPQDPDKSLLGNFVFNSTSSGFIGARDRLWYYNTSNEMCSSYQNIYETPEVPASNGTYVLKATRVGDQITYEWIPDNI